MNSASTPSASGKPPRYSTQVDGQSAESWSRILSEFDDANVYQTWTYGAVRWGEKSLSHLVLRNAETACAVAQLRIVRLPLIPVGIAYLRWGPACQRKGEELDAERVREMVAQLHAEYVQRRGLTLQVMPAASTTSARGDAFAAALSTAGLMPETGGTAYRTVVVDLAEPPDVIRKRLDQKWRNQLNRAEKNGLSLEIGSSENEYAEFLKLYAVMWDKKQFETSVDVDEFGRIQKALPASEKMQIFVARKDGQALGALVIAPMGSTAIYVLGATNDQAREQKAAYFLHWQAMMALKARGIRWYDLGGIDPETNPGGYHFKSGFGGEDLSHLPMHVSRSGVVGGLVLNAAGWWRSRRSAARHKAEGAKK